MNVIIYQINRNKEVNVGILENEKRIQTSDVIMWMSTSAHNGVLILIQGVVCKYMYNERTSCQTCKNSDCWDCKTNM